MRIEGNPTTAAAGEVVSNADVAMVRALRPADLEAVHRLVLACSDDCLRNRFFGHVADAAALLNGMAREAIWEGGAVGAFVKGAMVAVGVGIPDPGGTTWDVGLLVRDDWQGRLIGTRMLHRLVVEAQGAGVTPIAVVEAANGRAVRLVRRLGRTPEGGALRVEMW
jgi:GNAT superfamily N-acetyltransferase